MARKIVQIKNFAKAIDKLLLKKKVLLHDFEWFKKRLSESPDLGDLIPGTSGVRKIRLKSASKGKRGGFRVCYCDDPKDNQIFFLLIYQKNEQEDLSSEDKKMLKDLVNILKSS